MVTAVVTGTNFRGVIESTKVSFTFEKQHITSSSCDACPKKIWCSHLIAAILHRIKHASMVFIIFYYIPITNTSLKSFLWSEKPDQLRISIFPGCTWSDWSMMFLHLHLLQTVSKTPFKIVADDILFFSLENIYKAWQSRELSAAMTDT